MAAPTRFESTVHSGFLDKKGGNRKNWKRRWFYLEAGQVKYWPKECDVNDAKLPAPLGSFFVKNAQCSLVRSPKHKYQFQVSTPSRLWHLRGDSDEDVAEWRLRLEMNGAVWTIADDDGDDGDYDSSSDDPEA